MLSGSFMPNMVSSPVYTGVLSKRTCHARRGEELGGWEAMHGRFGVRRTVKIITTQ